MTREPDEPLFVVLPDPADRPVPATGSPYGYPGVMDPWSGQTTGPPTDPAIPPQHVAPVHERRPQQGSAPRPNRRRLWGALGVAGGLAAAVVLIAVFRPDGDPAAGPSPESSREPTSSSPSTPESPTTSSSPNTSSERSSSAAATASVVADPIPGTSDETEELGPCGTTLDTVGLSFEPVQDPTGVRLVFGTGSILDFDSGLIREPITDLDDDEIVSEIVQHGDTTFITIRDCEYRQARVVQVDTDGRTQPVRVPLGEGEVIGQILDAPDGPVAVVTAVDSGTLGYQQLTGGPLTPLPPNFSLHGAVGDRLVGTVWEQDGSGSVLLEVELSSGTVTPIAEFDAGDPGLQLIGGDHAYWAVNGDDGTPELTFYTISTGESRTVDWVMPDDFLPMTMSPTGNYLLGYTYPMEALASMEAYADIRLDYKVLDLGTGELTQIPSMLRMTEAYRSMALTFAPDGERVLIAARTPKGARFLTWKPGDARLQASPRVLPLDRFDSLLVLALPGQQRP